MKASALTKQDVTRKRTAGAKASASKRQPRMMVDDVTAIMLISPNPEKLCEFYKATLGLPLEEEMHGDGALHYGYSLGDVHFAIHSTAAWGNVRAKPAQSPTIAFSTSNVRAVARSLSASDVNITGPTDHGFGNVVSFRDPDGNSVLVIEYAPESG